MKVTAYKTPIVLPQSHDLFDLIDEALPVVPEGSVVAIAAKIVSLCEGSVVPLVGTDKDELIKQESQKYLKRDFGKYQVSLSIARNLLLASAGIDESNSGDYYVLWPKDLQASTNAIREHLVKKHGLKDVGVVMTDSATRPLYWGTTGICLAFSGFEALKSYIGEPDLFGRKMQYHTASISNGLAAAAVTVMGEGGEQTPLALIEDISFVHFQDRNPTTEELEALKIEPEDDLYWPLLENAPWQPGDQAQ